MTTLTPQAVANCTRVVIIGGGFAGLTAAKELANAPVRITLVDKTNHHLFQPLLYQVATAGLSPAEIAWPIRSVLSKQRNIEVLLAEVTGFDLDKKIVFLHDGRLFYDFLIIAAGGSTSYYNNPDWEVFAPGLKDLDDAVDIRRRVLLAFEAAEKENDENAIKKLLTFVVVGGGPTGVEMAGALQELSKFVLHKDFRHINPQKTKVLLIEGSPRILASFPEKLSKLAKDHLQSMGVEIRTNSRVTFINNEGVQLGDEFVESKTVIWAAGVVASSLSKLLGVPLDKSGRVIVEHDLSIPKRQEVFVIGDMAAFKDESGAFLPGVSPVAMQMGKMAAKNIHNLLKGRFSDTFVYKDKGSMATIGRKAAVVNIANHQLSGFLAWLCWLFVHIFFLIGFRSRISVFLNWAWSYFTYERGARLITGRFLTIPTAKAIKIDKFD